MATRWTVYLASLGTPVGGDHDGSEYLEQHSMIYDSSALDSEYSDKDNLIIYDPVLTREANEAGSFECDIPPYNTGYDEFDTYKDNVSGILKTYVAIYRDGNPYWQGRITEVTKDFNNNKHIYAEGDLALYNDFQCKITWADFEGYSDDNGRVMYLPLKFFTTVAQVPTNIPYGAEGKVTSPAFTYGIDAQLSDVLLMLGTNTSTDNTGDVVYMSRWEALKDHFLDGLMDTYQDRAFIYTSRYQTGTSSLVFKRQLNLLLFGTDGTLIWGESPETEQTVEFGKNLLDMNVKYSSEDVTTAIHAYGYTTKGWWIFEKTTPIERVDYNLDLIAQYGWIEKTISIDGQSSTIEQLTEIVDNELSQMVNNTSIVTEIEIKAVDLVYAGEATDHLEFMKRTHIVSEPHGIDGVYLCTRSVEHLDDPASNEYSFGKTTHTASQRKAISDRKTAKSYDISRTTKSYVVDS